LFVGMPLPPGPAYEVVTADVLAAAPRARPVQAGTWHVTLRFLGEVLRPEPVAAALDAACRGRPAMPCVVEGVGTFSAGFPPDKRARVVWAGVRAPGIEALAQAVQDATAAMSEAPEPRRFVAHATLARLPQPADLRSLVDRHRGTLFAQGVLDRVVLFRSRTGPGGAVHEPLHTVTLRQA
jgi:2'-5' RNA ligase